MRNRDSRDPRGPAAKTVSWPLAGLVAAVLILQGACGIGGAQPSLSGQIVRVLGSWTGEELAAFRDVLAPFETRTGIHVEYTATRDLGGVLREEIEAGTPPDLAGITGPADMAALARAGILKDLTSTVDLGAYKTETAPTFVELGTVEGHLVGVFIRASVKGLIWYDPHVLGAVMPTTWADLQRLIDRSASPDARAWCVGLASGESSGWPATDWIEDFLLRQAGPVAYDEWVAGSLPWTSTAVRSAFQAYGAVVAAPSVYGGPNVAVDTGFGEAGLPLFTSPPGCLFLHQGSFMQAFFEADGEVAGTDFDFFPFPTLGTGNDGAVIGGGDLFGLVTDRPAARAVLRYLVGPEAQSLWVAQGGTLSVNQEVRDYPDQVSGRAAQLLRQATRFRFDASDLMPTAMSAAFLQGVIAFTADPRQLDAVLTQLETTRRTAYRS